ncbi:hypothetical protein [Natronosalvus halobius]|uniref:hypothetical protein n=1 Tax=Natronosalvus halobius TaxID=2953746 RepID=UPI00209ED35F|nr:hypothetical protein [Natronosalvus halobius]USZ73766.1 hypothetical protein NGM15_18340 [Natronosalvus halobius]
MAQSQADRPEWLPDEYDADASLRERLPIMAEIDGGIELHVGDERGIVEIVGEPLELTENAAECYTLRTGSASKWRQGVWRNEIVVPKEHEAVLKSVDPEQSFEDYERTKKTELRGVDVRIYGIDHERLGREVPA